MIQKNRTKSSSISNRADFQRPAIAFEMLSDPLEQAQLRYGVRNLPDTFVIDRNGIVRDRVKGAIAWDDPTVIRYLQALVRG
ncbi:peroxiredoxin family protein [Geobacter anodireducens]